LGPRPPRPPKAPQRKRPPDDRPVYVRFVCFQLVSGQRTRLGLFQALDEARMSDHAADWALAELRETVDWFNEELAAPKRFSRDSWNGGDQPTLSWFKASAEEHIKQMYRLKTALENCGVHVEVLTTREPGCVLYEDEHQIAAEPLDGRF
jgi:hypothetical protein